MKKNLPKFGFTLIEIMIAVVVGGILFSGGIAAYRSFGEKQAVKQAGNTFRINLKLFQQKALSGEKPVECLGSISGYRVSYVNESSYSLQVDCSVSDPGISTVSLGENVYFTSDWGEVFFGVLQTQVSGAGDVEITNGDFIYTVTVEPIGVIKGDFQE